MKTLRVEIQVAIYRSHLGFWPGECPKFSADSGGDGNTTTTAPFRLEQRFGRGVVVPPWS